MIDIPSVWVAKVQEISKLLDILPAYNELLGAKQAVPVMKHNKVKTLREV